MLVLVTAANREPVTGAASTADKVRPARAEVWVAAPVIQAIRQAGGQPLLLAPGEEHLSELLDRVQAVVLPGGHFDIHPSHYGETVQGRLDAPDEGRTHTELAVARACVERDLPVLGVCGGMQALAVACGGRLHQDIATEIPNALDHEQPTDPATPWHEVLLQPGRLHTAMGPRVQVNSTHHQAVSDPGSLVVTGRAPDGVVEVVESEGHRFCVGLQWHPELLDIAPFTALLEACK
jgi:putative glutamine amidotransferase